MKLIFTYVCICGHDGVNRSKRVDRLVGRAVITKWFVSRKVWSVEQLETV